MTLNFGKIGWDCGRASKAVTPGPAALSLALILALILVWADTTPARAQGSANPYPRRAAITAYLIPKPTDEIALARSAAPNSLSDHAEVLVLGARGYETAVKGDNGFVCLVLRAWASGFDDPGFWNPRQRAPICYNAAAARSVLPSDLRRARWALAGLTKTAMAGRTRDLVAARAIPAPEAGAMSYMMSKQGYLNDRDGHWHPHLMIYLPRVKPAVWGANLPGGAIVADDTSLEPLTVFFIPVPHWSDGEAASLGH